MPPHNRMTANPVKPARYRAGKAAGPASESEASGSEEDDEPQKKAPPRRAPPPRFTSASGPGRVISRGDGAKINLQGVAVADARDEEARRQAARVARLEAEKKAKEEGFVTEEEDEGGESDEEGSEEESEEEDESEEEEEAPRRLMMRPKFIPKSQRQASGSGTATAGLTSETNPSEEDAAAAEEARLKAADALIEEQIKKDLAARAAGKKHWESDDGGSDKEVDDTDDIDPEAEYAAWKLRELKRLRREREAIEVKEKELAEIERRRNLTEEERQAEDEEHLAKQREEKESRGKLAYMQKYFHKGAFYHDESKAAGLDKRDLVGAKFADDVNRELLPKALQLRDQTKVGKKGATKYRDLKSEDTGQWGRLDDGRPKREFDRNVDERFQPDDRRRDWDKGGDSGAKGANAIPLGDRRDKPREEDRDRYRRNDREEGKSRDRSRDRYRDDGHDSYRRRDSSRDRRRSRSPRHDRDDRDDRRKRSLSRDRDGDRYESDKRRRVEAR
ncbi:hypothetical protein N658DRAFT_160858 [Parathielavia hyrcaniae]|uniref:Micro-fibrillar-associated protein 1 C-terminal domain-containing protein n=1 Tax=Parathielavia hyrcaniae TaxID=113614 RepID=A0AAN6SZU8_9PEZI|nr:hypothetical protein N658DRAFT_160858 [Parathielavia hyrcaniae]